MKQGQILAKEKYPSFRIKAETDFEAHPVSYSVATGAYFSDGREAGAWSSSLVSI